MDFEQQTDKYRKMDIIFVTFFVPIERFGLFWARQTFSLQSKNEIKFYAFRSHTVRNFENIQLAPFYNQLSTIATGNVIHSAQ